MATNETVTAARSSQACEACRNQKARCRPSSVQNICEKCLQAGKHCIPHIPKVRSRGRKYSRRSLARIERRIDELCQRINLQPTAEDSALSSDRQASYRVQPAAIANGPQVDTKNVLSSVWNQERENHSAQQKLKSESAAASSDNAEVLQVCVKGSFELRKDVFYGQSLAPSSSHPTAIDKIPGQMLLEILGSPNESSVEKIGPLQSLCISEADQLLAAFRSMALHFPIFFFPERASCIDCVQQKPFVVLAMLVASSVTNGRLRTACDFMFRTILARQVIVEGKKSLDLLQGLLIYLAWYHHYLQHETQQIYQYLQLAIGMVVDLGLNKPKQRPQPTLSRVGQSPERMSTEGLTAEEERALLGCYSLSCGLAVLGFDKPQNLAYSEHLRRCSQDLAQHGSYVTDKDWLPTIDLLHIAEEIQKSPRTNAETGLALLLAHVRDIEQQLQHWKYQNLTGTRDHARLSLAFHFVQIYLYETALFTGRSTQPQGRPQAQDGSIQPPGAPVLLQSTLHATHAFLDDILIKPASLLRNMNIVEWTHLITAAITLARLARLGPDQMRETGIEHAQIKTQVDVYILTLCKRISDMGIGNVEGDPKGLFSWFKAIAQGIRLWVSGSDEANEPEHAEAKIVAPSITHSSATSAVDTVKSLTSQTQLGHQEGGPNKTQTADRNSTRETQGAVSDGYEMVSDDNFWNVFILNWPYITIGA